MKSLKFLSVQEKKRPDIVAKSFVGDQSLVSDLEKALDKNKLKGQ